MLGHNSYSRHTHTGPYPETVEQTFKNIMKWSTRGNTTAKTERHSLLSGQAVLGLTEARVSVLELVWSSTWTIVIMYTPSDLVTHPWTHGIKYSFEYHLICSQRYLTTLHCIVGFLYFDWYISSLSWSIDSDWDWLYILHHKWAQIRLTVVHKLIEAPALYLVIDLNSAGLVMSVASAVSN